MVKSKIKGPFYIQRISTDGGVRTMEGPKELLPMVGFLYLTSGEVLVETDGKAFLCSAGHLLLIPGNRPFTVLYYSDARGYKGGFQYLKFLAEPVQQAFWFDEAVFVGELFNMFMLYYERKDRSAFIEVGIELLLTRVKTMPETSRLPKKVSDFLDKLFSGNQPLLPPCNYAAESGVTLNYLNRAVKKSTGRPLSAWIDIARLNRAEKLLQDKSVPIIDVASSVGILNQAYFARFFKKQTGMTPSQFRKAMH